MSAIAGIASIVTTIVQAVATPPTASWATPVLIAAALFFGRKWVNGITSRLDAIEANQNAEKVQTTQNQRNLLELASKVERLIQVCPAFFGRHDAEDD